MKLISAFASCLVIFSIIGCTTNLGHKKQFGNLDIYYTSTVTMSEVDALGDYLIKADIDKNGQHKTVKLNRSGEVYEVNVVVKKGIEQDAEYQEIFKAFARGISHDVFNDAPVEIHACDDHFNLLRVFPMKREE